MTDAISPISEMNNRKNELADAGHRRHLSWGMDFDTRALMLSQEIGEHWEERVKELHIQNRENTRAGLIAEFGELGAEAKIENFKAIDAKPFSIISYHNGLFHQVRQAFVIGAYYPALLGACALGERILNHLVLDLREEFRGTPQYKNVYRKDLFDKWHVPIDTLEAWGVLLPEVVEDCPSSDNLRQLAV